MRSKPLRLYCYLPLVLAVIAVVAVLAGCGGKGGGY